MLWQTALLFCALFVQQVPAEYAKAVYVEDVVPESSQSRIVSGWEAKPGEHPHQVLLRLVNSNGAIYGCGGSVVHKEWVITAAHCSALAVRIIIHAGVTHIAQAEHISETYVWYNHPRFDDSRPNVVQPNDIALLYLQEQLVFSKNIQPIRVQPSRDAFRDYNGQRVIASGFGRTWTNGPQPEVLNWVYLTAISNQNCANTFGQWLINANAICARFYNVTSQSICQGDSGGPLLIEENGVRTLIGISSFVAGGNFGCHSGLPGGFIRPGPYHSWFSTMTGLDFENLIEDDETTTRPPTSITTPETPATTPTSPVPSTTPSTPATTTTPSPPETTTTPSPPETTTTPSPPDSTTTPAPPTPEKPDDDSESDEGSSEEEDADLDLLKRLEVKVKVKVRLSKLVRALANQK